MRVLWFTNIPLLPVIRKLGIPNFVTGSWMDSLRLALQKYPDLELGVASASEFDYNSFEENGTVYYNLLKPSKKRSLGTVYRRWLHTTELHNGIRYCLNIIEQFKPDLIHIHGSEDFFGLIAKETSIPIVVSIQGILTVIENRYFGSFTFSDELMGIFSLKFLTGSSFFHKYLLIKKSARREREILKLCKYYIGRTEFDKNFVSLINPNSHYYHCDDVLRPPFYLDEWEPRFSDRRIIYCITSPSPFKGLDCLLKACNILKRNGFHNLQIRISGQIQNSDIWSVINRKIEGLELKNNVVLLGPTSSDVIVTELKKADVFVLPSSIENASCSLGEAMLVGTPCVASYVGGVPSEICHGKDGLFFPSGDFYSLAGMIAKILRDPTLARTLSDNAKTTAKKRHDPIVISSTLMGIYSEIIADSFSGER